MGATEDDTESKTSGDRDESGTEAEEMTKSGRGVAETEGEEEDG